MATTLVSCCPGDAFSLSRDDRGDHTQRQRVARWCIKEKVLAAKRAGVTDVILPAENKMNVEEDLTPEQLENLNIHYVKTIDEACTCLCPQWRRGRQRRSCLRRRKIPSRTRTHAAVKSPRECSLATRSLNGSEICEKRNSCQSSHDGWQFILFGSPAVPWTSR